MHRWTRVALLAVSLALLPLGCLGISRPIVHLCECRYVTAVSSPVPSDFPVLVAWWGPGGTPAARIVYYKDLTKARASHPGSTLMVPRDELGAVNAYLHKHTREYTGRAGDPWIMMVRTQTDPDGRAVLRVEGSYEDKYVNVGWYTARPGSIHPLRQMRYYGPGLLMAIFPLAFLITLALWVLGYRVVERVMNLETEGESSEPHRDPLFSVEHSARAHHPRSGYWRPPL